MGTLWAHTGTIECIVLISPYKFPLTYGETMTEYDDKIWVHGKEVIRCTKSK